VLHLERVEPLAAEIGDQVQPDRALVAFGRLGLEVGDVHLKQYRRYSASLQERSGAGMPRWDSIYRADDQVLVNTHIYGFPAS
jgi:hypothetical protein